jgi:glycosyltransferase involved in cell wall biosynthesis
MIESRISVITSTFGSDTWRQRGSDLMHEIEATQQFKPLEVIHVHDKKLHLARNKGAEQARGSWLLFVDADDSIDSGFVEAMEHAIEEYDDRYLIRPAITVSNEPERGPHVLVEKDIFFQNFMIIGTLVSKKMFLKSGGFKDLPLYEDWDLWIRCKTHGARYAACEDAIYHINIRPDSRNNQPTAIQNRVAQDIRKAYRFRRQVR